MNYIYFFILMILPVSQANLLSQTDLNILWENKFVIDKIRFINIQDVSFDNNHYVLTFNGQTPQQKDSIIQMIHSPGFLEISSSGDLIQNISVILKSENTPFTTKIISNGYKFYSKNWSKRLILTGDEKGDSVTAIECAFPYGYQVSSNPIRHGDTLIQLVKDVSNNKSSLYYFDWNFNIINELKLESPELPKPTLSDISFGMYKEDENEYIQLITDQNVNFSNTHEYGYLVKNDLDGKLLFNTEIAMPNNDLMTIDFVSKKKDGNYIVVCVPISNNNKELLFIEISNEGGLISQKYIEKGTNSPFSDIYWLRFKQLSDDRIAAYGYKLIKDSPKGLSFLYIYNINGESLERYEWIYKPTLSNIFEKDDGNLIIIGKNSSSKADSVYIAEIRPRYLSIDDDNHNKKSNPMISPNPASDFIDIKLTEGLEPSESYHVEIFDILGIEVMFESIQTMTQSHRINVSGFPAGVYYIRIGDKVEKFLKM